MVIATNKPQTTRNLIEISYTHNSDYLINFIDTPGLHLPKNKFDNFLNGQIKKALKRCEIHLFLFDVSRTYDKEDQECLKVLKDFHCENVILVLNKIDLVDADKLNRIIQELQQHYAFKNTIAICANEQNDVQKLIDLIIKSAAFNEVDNLEINSIKKEINDKFMVSELIREAAINLLSHELPYGIAIVIEEMKYEKENNLLSISYAIVVEKESHKAIVVGKNGSMVKKINILVREKLLEIYDCKIFTSSYVKVKKNWRQKESLIKALGYQK